MTKMQLFVLSLLPAIPAGLLLVTLFGAFTSMNNFSAMVWILWLAAFVAGLFVLGLAGGIFFLYRPEAAGAGAALAAPEATDDEVEAIQDTDSDVDDFDDAEDFADSDEIMEADDDEFDDFDDDEDFV